MKPPIFATGAATIAACAALALAAPLPVTAQSVPPAAAQPAPVDDAEVRSFAAAVVEVKRVADSYIPALAVAKTPTEQERVEDAVFSEIKQVVESEGFTVWRFNQILAMANVSPDLVERIREHLP